MTDIWKHKQTRGGYKKVSEMARRYQPIGGGPPIVGAGAASTQNRFASPQGQAETGGLLPGKTPSFPEGDAASLSSSLQLTRPAAQPFNYVKAVGSSGIAAAPKTCTAAPKTRAAAQGLWEQRPPKPATKGHPAPATPQSE